MYGGYRYDGAQLSRQKTDSTGLFVLGPRKKRAKEKMMWDISYWSKYRSLRRRSTKSGYIAYSNLSWFFFFYYVLEVVKEALGEN
jgi:hypothetical protein